MDNPINAKLRANREAVRTKVAEKTAVDRALENLTVAPDEVVAPPAPSRYTTATPSRYSTPTVSRYSAPAQSRYAAPDASKYSAPVSRYGGRYHEATKPRGVHRFIQHTLLVVPPPRKKRGDMVWLPTFKFARAFQQFPTNYLWPLGGAVHFNDAAISQYAMSPRRDSWVYGRQIPDVAAILTPGHDPSRDWCDSPVWEEVMELGRTLRAELAADPEYVAARLDIQDVMGLERLSGCGFLPMVPDVAAAIAEDPRHGLGAAALDYATWCVSNQMDRHTELAMALCQTREEAERQDEGIEREFTVENFFIPTGSLHPNTRRVVSDRGAVSYELYASYAVAGITYDADPTGSCLGGFRSVYLEAVGQPKRPDLPSQAAREQLRSKQ